MSRWGRPIVFTEEVLRLLPEWLNRGDSYEEIAARIGSTPESVKQSCWKYGISLRKGRAKRRYYVSLPEEGAEKLSEYAATRQLSLEEVMTEMVRVVCKDNLFAALFD